MPELSQVMILSTRNLFLWYSLRNLVAQVQWPGDKHQSDISYRCMTEAVDWTIGNKGTTFPPPVPCCISILYSKAVRGWYCAPLEPVIYKCLGRLAAFPYTLTEFPNLIFSVFFSVSSVAFLHGHLQSACFLSTLIPLEDMLLPCCLQ